MNRKDLIIIGLVVLVGFFIWQTHQQIVEQSYTQGIQDGINLTQNQILKIALQQGYLDLSFPTDQNTVKTERFWAETIINQELAKIQNQNLQSTPNNFSTGE